MKDGPLILLLSLALAAYCCGKRSEASEPEPRQERILEILESTQPSQFDDETPAHRAERLSELAVAMARAARTDAEAAALLAIGQLESGNWAEYVQAGCNYPSGIPEGASNCDRGTSRSPWQVKRAACPAGWREERGSRESLEVFAVCARKRFLGALTRCRGRHPGGDIAGAMAGYRSIDCAWEGRTSDGARARARLYQHRYYQLAR